MHDDLVTDERPEIPTVFDRLVAAGLSQERLEQHLTAGRVRVDGELCADLAGQRRRPPGSCWGRSKRQPDSLACGDQPLRGLRHRWRRRGAQPVQRTCGVRRAAGRG
jgi:hypothetical protein